MSDVFGILAEKRPPGGQLGLVDSLLGLTERVRVSWLFPSLGIGAEGSARLCTSDHLPIVWLGAPERPPGPLHVDVEVRLWNKGREPITVFEPIFATAAGQDLKWDEPGYLGAFSEETLDVGGRRVEEHFRLRPPEGVDLSAGIDDKVEVRIRASRGRPRRIRLEIADRARAKS